MSLNSKECMARPIPSHDSISQDKDFLNRFLNCLMDQKAHHQVEFVKDPS